MNKSELEVARYLESQGWRVIRGGAPDLLCVKEGKFGKILDVVFVEVKRDRRDLTYKQKMYRRALESLGAKYLLARFRQGAFSFEPSEPKPPCSHLRLPPWAEKIAEKILEIDAQTERNVYGRGERRGPERKRGVGGGSVPVVGGGSNSKRGPPEVPSDG